MDNRTPTLMCKIKAGLLQVYHYLKSQLEEGPIRILNPETAFTLKVRAATEGWSTIHRIKLLFSELELLNKFIIKF
jgi:hypothetical protein